MKQIKIFPLAIAITYFTIYGSVNSNIKQTNYKDQTALKGSLYLKNDSDIAKKHWCDEFIIKEWDAFWDQGNTKMYCSFPKTRSDMEMEKKILFLYPYHFNVQQSLFQRLLITYL